MKRSPLKPRTKRPNPVNRKRRASEFARTYHSKERVAFVKSLGCMFRGSQCWGPIDNAHAEGDGMGRKAGYEKIAPMCRAHHRNYDEVVKDHPGTRSIVLMEADDTEAAWQRLHGEDNQETRENDND